MTRLLLKYQGLLPPFLFSFFFHLQREIMLTVKFIPFTTLFSKLDFLKLLLWFLLLLLFFMLFCLWDVSSPTRDWTHAPCIGNAEPRLLDLQGSPPFITLYGAWTWKEQSCMTHKEDSAQPVHAAGLGRIPVKPDSSESNCNQCNESALERQLCLCPDSPYPDKQ